VASRLQEVHLSIQRMSDEDSSVNKALDRLKERVARGSATPNDVDAVRKEFQGAVSHASSDLAEFLSMEVPDSALSVDEPAPSDEGSSNRTGPGNDPSNDPSTAGGKGGKKDH